MRNDGDKLVVTAGVIFVACWFSPYPERSRYDNPQEPRHQPEYEIILTREHGPMRYLGPGHLGMGGCDVYSQKDGKQWWIVGPKRRCVSCEPFDWSAKETMDRLVAEIIRTERFEAGDVD